jgi:hypothetical protein
MLLGRSSLELLIALVRAAARHTTAAVLVPYPLAHVTLLASSVSTRKTPSITSTGCGPVILTHWDELY